MASATATSPDTLAAASEPTVNLEETAVTSTSAAANEADAPSTTQSKSPGSAPAPDPTLTPITTTTSPTPTPRPVTVCPPSALKGSKSGPNTASVTFPPKCATIDRKFVILPEKEELVSSSPAQRNWRGILIALLVIVAVLGLIMFSIILLSPPNEGPRVKGAKFTLQDIIGYHFRAPRFNGTWVSETELVFRDAYGGLSLFNAENMTTLDLLTNSTFRQHSYVDFIVSPSVKYVLLISEVIKEFEHSFEAKYTVYEVGTKKRFWLTQKAAPVSATVVESQPYLQLVQWAPNGSLAFVMKNDVYYKPNPRAPAVRLTQTGQTGVIFNGVPDWLYEVEILQSASALWFSPDSSLLLLASFNDSLVGEHKYPWYGSLRENFRYPKERSLRYPKAGTPIPTARLRLLQLNQTSFPADSLIELRPPPSVLKGSLDHYFTSVTWVNPRVVSIVWMNRRQNVSCISVCSWPSWNCQDAHVERGSAAATTALKSNPLFSADGSSLAAALVLPEADTGGFNTGFAGGLPQASSSTQARIACQVGVLTQRVTPLSPLGVSVDRLLAWDQELHQIYFLAAPLHSPDQRYVYRVGDTEADSLRSSPQCLTCPPQRIQLLCPEDEIPGTVGEGAFTTPMSSINDSVADWQFGIAGAPVCLFSNAIFSPGRSPRFYVLECLGPDTPAAYVIDAVNNARIATIQLNSQLRQRYNNMARPQVKIFQVELIEGYHAQVRMYLPPGLREYEDMAFPLILQVDASPGSQLVTQRWSVDWATYLASYRNFIVAQIDARGSAFHGDRPSGRALGTIELEDQIAVLTYIRNTFKYVDRDRIGIWGKGYGGFAAAVMLGQEPNLFSCGISLSPITSWAHYDAAFTERYMGTPNVTDNYRGYEEADLPRRSESLRDKRFLLIHGTADLRVHYLHTMLLVRALTNRDVLFQHQTYPDEGHSYEGVQEHLYRVMEAFWEECFGPLDFQEWEEGTSFFAFKQ